MSSGVMSHLELFFWLITSQSTSFPIAQIIFAWCTDLSGLPGGVLSQKWRT
jgi:hypothetical protein